ncbi:MAG: cardiolipin synthase [Clostridia bacterium]|nr:cardiolipin synthase [Clostridia bacterium]
MKKLFSRFSLVAMTIILLFVLFVVFFAAVVWLLNNILIYYFPQTEIWVRLTFALLDWLILVLTVIHAANRDMVPETKIPWILCIVGLNVFGVATYIVFSNNRPTKKKRLLYTKIYRENAGTNPRVISVEDAEKALGSWSGVSEALYAVNSSAVLHDGTKTEYFPVGEEFAERLLGDLERAEKYIFMEYFIIARGELWSRILNVLQRKVQEGVEVRFMYDDIGCMGKVHMRYHKTMQKMGIKCVKFNRFVPIVSNIHNNRDHRKITVIDGKIGYTGGLNLADEYVNVTHPFGHWKDTAVRLEGAGVKNLLLMFLGLYAVGSNKAEDVTKYIPESYERFEGEGYVQPYGDGPYPLYGRCIGEDVYINVLNNAKRYVDIMTPYLIIDYRMREALVLAAKRGVRVRILLPHIPDKKIPFALARSNYMALIRGGVEIYEYTPGFVHAKSFLADDETAVVGTINLDYRSLLFHYEDAVIMYKTKAIAQIKADMDSTFALSARQTQADAKKNVISRGLSEIAKLFAPLF